MRRAGSDETVRNADLFLRPLFDWRAAVASPLGPKNPTTRLVLLTLSLHMSVKGDSCFPSGELLAAESGLSRRAVVVNLALATKEGWIAKRERPEKNGQGWRRIEYFALIPQGVEQALRDHPRKGGDPKSLRRGGDPDDKGGDPGDQKVGNQDHTSSSLELFKEQHKPRAAARGIALKALTYLNTKAGTHYRATEPNLKFAIDRQLRDGATEADLLAVVDLKVADRDFDRKYLRPETLWNATKFAGYIGQVGAQPPAAQPDTQVTIFGEHEDGRTVVLYTTSGRGEPDPERLARRAIEAGYVRTKFHNLPCRNIVVEWQGHRSKYAMRELEQGRRA